MTQSENELWKRIQGFDLDEEGTSLSFSRRLARENGWSPEYTTRVVQEYRKFLFLCCICETPVTPSDAVDQAWHLHLTYTKSYWKDLCKNTLQKEIHHTPTKGGEAEKDKYSACYTTLHELYAAKFGEEPPQDIWPGNEERFLDINFRRVNMNKHWMVPKPAVGKFVSVIVFVLFIGALALANVPVAVIIVLSMIYIAFMIFFTSESRGKSSSSSGGADTGGVWWFAIWGSNNDNDSDSSDGNGDSGCSGCGGCGGD